MSSAGTFLKCVGLSPGFPGGGKIVGSSTEYSVGGAVGKYYTIGALLTNLRTSFYNNQINVCVLMRCNRFE